MNNGLPIYGENLRICICILGSFSSYMTLHPIRSKFPYIWGSSVFFFISVVIFENSSLGNVVWFGYIVQLSRGGGIFSLHKVITTCHRTCYRRGRGDTAFFINYILCTVNICRLGAYHTKPNRDVMLPRFHVTEVSTWYLYLMVESKAPVSWFQILNTSQT